MYAAWQQTANYCLASGRSGRWNDGRFAMRRRRRAIAAPARQPDGGQVRLEAFAFAARGCAQVYFGKVLLESLTGRRVWLYQLCNRPVQVEMRGSTTRLSARLQCCLGQVPRHSQGCVLVSGPCKGKHDAEPRGRNSFVRYLCWAPGDTGRCRSQEANGLVQWGGGHVHVDLHASALGNGCEGDSCLASTTAAGSCKTSIQPLDRYRPWRHQRTVAELRRTGRGPWAVGSGQWASWSSHQWAWERRVPVN